MSEACLRIVVARSGAPLKATFIAILRSASLVELNDEEERKRGDEHGALQIGRLWRRGGRLEVGADIVRDDFIRNRNGRIVFTSSLMEDN